MTVNIHPEPAQALWVDRYVREDHPVQNSDPVNLIEVFQVLFRREDVMVPPDQPQMSVESGHSTDVTLLHGNVAEVVDVILRPDDRVPPLDHVLVHLLDRRELPQRRPVLPFEREDVRVPEVGI